MEVDKGARLIDRELIDGVSKAVFDTSSLDLIASSLLVILRLVSDRDAATACGTNGLFLLLNPVFLEAKALVEGEVELEVKATEDVEAEAAADERSRLEAPVSPLASFDSNSCFFFLIPNPLSILSN